MSNNRLWTDRSAVFIVQVGEDFRPQSPWNLPATFTQAEIYAKNLPLEDARAAVRTLNKAAIESWVADHAAWDRRWAIVVACPRAKGLDRCIHVVTANLSKRGA